MNTYLVSDIHGQYQALRTALNRVSFSPQNQDRLYVIGDMVDRGPESKEVLEYLFQLQSRHPSQIFLLKGNHEQMFQDWLNSAIDPDLYLRLNGGDATVRSFLGRQALRRAFLGQVPSPEAQDAARQEIVSRHPYLLPALEALPLTMELPASASPSGNPALLVHAGIVPGVPLAEQRPFDLLWIREPFYDHYQGETTIFFGHTPVTRLPQYAGQGPWQRGNLIGIDGGAASSQGGILLVNVPSLQFTYVPIRDIRSAPRIRVN
ncbi:serine/threonine protein phosphatase [Brevibacillus ruminantium]|uniref:Serine/threonine protein phosphatase n=1 Tax=Brevibacillus ruminantium TaxID=2950604 RepID=A0ABY4WAI3_9BACL|nr:metallophosphoesterase family protein [Brevibacillus ruminantium]USG63939.1 serine/threonine protein phosphatase [Brevibacillus ruminantium]